MTDWLRTGTRAEACKENNEQHDKAQSQNRSHVNKRNNKVDL